MLIMSCAYPCDLIQTHSRTAEANPCDSFCDLMPYQCLPFHSEPGYKNESCFLLPYTAIGETFK